LVKNFRSIATQLDDEQYGKLIQICKDQECTPYYVIKDLLQQYIENYELFVKEELEKEKQKEARLGKEDESELDSHENVGKDTQSEPLDSEINRRSRSPVIRIRG